MSLHDVVDVKTLGACLSAHEVQVPSLGRACFSELLEILEELLLPDGLAPAFPINERELGNPAVRDEIERVPRIPGGQGDRRNTFSTLKDLVKAHEHPHRVHDVIDLGRSTLDQDRGEQQFRCDELLAKEGPQRRPVLPHDEALDARHRACELTTTKTSHPTKCVHHHSIISDTPPLVHGDDCGPPDQHWCICLRPYS
jgi:hypothetical protein